MEAHLGTLLHQATVAALLTHELDAVRRHEWRMHPLTSWLPEHIAAPTFVWAHVPLLLALQALADALGQPAFRAGVAAFALLHAGLHWAYRHHPRNELRGHGAWTLILMAGLCGAAYLALLASTSADLRRPAP
jgi:hypothetical protein